MLTRFTILSLFILIAGIIHAQDSTHGAKLVAEGNRYFTQEQYNLAAQFYRDAISRNVTDPAVDYKLAECYRKIFNHTEAEAYYLKVFYTGPGSFPLSLYYYALMLKLNGNFTEAMERFDQFIAFHKDNSTLADFVEQAIIEKAGCEIAHQEFGIPVATKANLFQGEINTIYNDFAPAFADDGTLVVTSSRITSNRNLIDERNGEAFTDNYVFQRSGEVWENKTRQIFPGINSVYHDGSGTFTRKGDQYFFTVCEQRCTIYETHLEGNKWSKPSMLNERVNYPGADAKQPAISPGGDTLYFASTRPGGFGEFDIWMSIDAGDNDWTTPTNAGRFINTKGNDIAPAVTNIKSVLFFSSEGHPGYGGFDLFVAKAISTGDTVLYNLSFPFNSTKDDCFITFKGQEVLWSSNREGGKGGFDIYTASRVSALSLVSRLSLKNRNDSRTVTLTSRTAQSEKITLLASRNEETIDYNNLTYERKVLVNRMLENRLNNVRNTHEDFADLTQDEFELLNELSFVRFQAVLLREKYSSTLLTEVAATPDAEGPLSITGQIIDTRSGYALHGVRVLLANEHGEILKITSTNNEGNFRFTDVSQDSKLFLRLENAGGWTITAAARDIKTMGSNKENSHYVENVYFDFDHYIIRPEAAKVLHELAAYLKSNPGAQVEIYAFADDRGSSAYNFELTQKRGETVAGFLIKQGVDATSLAIIPKGKTHIRIAASEIQRQYNRRAEFYINGVNNTFTPSVKTYILKKDSNWDLIEKLTGISKDELKALNDAQTDSIKAFQPVRVPMHARTVSDDLFFVGI